MAAIHKIHLPHWRKKWRSAGALSSCWEEKWKNSPLRFDQEVVMTDYRNASILRRYPKAEGYLHMFFSPWRVPVGLTDNEVAICVRLYPARVRLTAKYNADEDAKIARLNLPYSPTPTLCDALELFEKIPDGYANVSEAQEHLYQFWGMYEHMKRHPIRTFFLPMELCPSKVMTRKNFRKGIRKVIAEYRKAFPKP
ncbi:MAG: hypothetical protein V4697_01860 [Patescibacteria group bacterium]